LVFEEREAQRYPRGVSAASTAQRRIYAVVARIPKGRVATYGQVATLAGLPRRARLVGQALRVVPDGVEIPWHRVVNAQGKISARADALAHEDLQAALLRREGVRFTGASIPLARYRWEPEGKRAPKAAAAADSIRVKRVYDRPSPDDGVRVLVDRLWPRGVSKAAARVDAWMKELAPSAALRTWFGHDPDRWPEFRRRYHRELTATDARHELLALADHQPLTLLFAAKDPVHNNAVALREFLARVRR
jgi:O-6-methylguanine DNA methyltransferase